MDQQYLDFALELAKKAWELMRKNFTLNMKKEWKSDNSPVTETDIFINSLVIESIHKNFPTHSIIGEEWSDIYESSEFSWVCDPVDGTIPFSHGIPVSTFALALTQNWEVIVAVVYDPFLDRLFYATKGGWAFLNWDAIHVRNWNKLDNLLIWMEWWKWDKFRIWNWDYSKISEYLTEEYDCKIMKYNSVVYMWMLVACWEFWWVLFPGGCPWDIATVKLIVEEAWWRVTNLKWEEDKYNWKWGSCFGMIASNKDIHPKFLELVLPNLKFNIKKI